MLLEKLAGYDIPTPSLNWSLADRGFQETCRCLDSFLMMLYTGHGSVEIKS